MAHHKMSADLGRLISESRVGDAFMKVYDRSNDEKFQLLIESNVLNKYKFSVKAFGNKVSIVGLYEEKVGDAVNEQKMSYDYFLPNDVDPNQVKAIEYKQNLTIEAPRKKRLLR